MARRKAQTQAARAQQQLQALQGYQPSYVQQSSLQGAQAGVSQIEEQRQQESDENDVRPQQFPWTPIQ